MAKYKKRADGRYCSQISLGRDPETGKLVRKTIYGRTIRELEDALAEIRRQQSTGIIIDDQQLSVAQWARQWLTAYKGDVSAKTKEFYGMAIEKHIIPVIGSYKLKDIREHHLQELLNRLAQAKYIPVNKKDQNTEGRPYARRTLDRVRITLGAIFGRAYRNHLIVENPAAYLETPKNLRYTAPREALTERDRETLLTCAENHVLGAFVLILYYTGMRRGEALALTPKDFDFKSREIKISKSVGYKEDHTAFLKEPKTRSGIRTVPILPPLEPIAKNLCKGKMPGALLFPDFRNPAALKPSGQLFSQWDKFMRDCNKLAGGNSKITVFRRITPHALRHNFATILFDAGVDLKTAQRIMGHSDVSTLMDIYTHLSEKREKQSLTALADYFSVQSECSQSGNG